MKTDWRYNRDEDNVKAHDVLGLKQTSLAQALYCYDYRRDPKPDIFQDDALTHLPPRAWLDGARRAPPSNPRNDLEACDGHELPVCRYGRLIYCV